MKKLILAVAAVIMLSAPAHAETMVRNDQIECVAAFAVAKNNIWDKFYPFPPVGESLERVRSLTQASNNAFASPPALWGHGAEIDKAKREFVLRKYHPYYLKSAVKGCLKRWRED